MNRSPQRSSYGPATVGCFQLQWGRTFGELGPGDPLLYEDSYGRACIAVNQGSAVRTLDLRDGTRLELRRR